MVSRGTDIRGPGWGFSTTAPASSSALCFKTDKSIILYGIGVFCATGKCTVKISVKDDSDHFMGESEKTEFDGISDSQLIKQPKRLNFVNKIPIAANKNYEIVLDQISSTNSCYLENCKNEVINEGVNLYLVQVKKVQMVQTQNVDKSLFYIVGYINKCFCCILLVIL